MDDIVYSCAIMTLSDKGALGEREDTSGPTLRKMLAENGFSIVAGVILPDEFAQIAATLKKWVDEDHIDLIVTTGGTGVSPRDVTPEATRTILEREIPGLAEAMRQASLQKTVQAVWSRGIAGMRGQSLIINLPGSEKAARENLAAILPALRHGLYKLKGGSADCAAV